MTLQLISFSLKNRSTLPEYNFRYNCSKLPSPNASLRKKTGVNKDLQRDLFEHKNVQLLYQKIVKEISQSDLTDVTVCISCHAGRHRSVAMVEMLAKDQHLRIKFPQIEKIHTALTTI